MKKTLGFYSAIWGVCLVVFNLICFIVPRFFSSFDKFGGAFWAGYVAITVAFIGQLVCGFFAFKEQNLQKMFYNLPLFSICEKGLIAMLVLGSVCMIIPDFPNWLGGIVCLIVLVFTVIAVFKASIATEAINDIDVKVKQKTQFIKLLTVQAENIMARADTDEKKAACKKVYEAARYSDPMSDDALKDVEERINSKMIVFADCIDTGRNIAESADELVNLIGDRNRMCKAFK